MKNAQYVSKNHGLSSLGEKETRVISLKVGGYALLIVSFIFHFTKILKLSAEKCNQNNKNLLIKFKWFKQQVFP